MEIKVPIETKLDIILWAWGATEEILDVKKRSWGSFKNFLQNLIYVSIFFIEI